MDVTDTTSVQALVYYRYFLQRVTNGNAPNDTPCNDGSGLLCFDGGFSTTLGGAFIPDFLNGGPYSELDNQTTNTNAYGASAQVTNTNDLFGLKNHFVAGLSFDGAQTMFSAVSFIGGLTALDRVFIGPGVVIDEPGTNSPVRVAISNATYGLYIADTLNLTPQLAVTLSGRFNAALIDLNDQNGGDLTGNHSYNHFNPAAGITYQFAPWLTAYAGYAVANRAPTPAELSCAGPANSCSLANFFVGDPNLQQVVSHTVEAGVRGTFAPFDGANLSYNLALFHSNLDNDIAFINSVTQGRAFFANIGQTRRQGVDVGAQLKTDRWLAYVAYTYISATFQSGFVEASGNNPAADANGNLSIRPGNRLPGIPANQLKVGAYYKVTDKWTVGASAIVCQQRLPVRRRGQSHATAARLLHDEPHHDVSTDQECPVVRLGREYHQRALLYVRHILADQFGVSRAGPRCNQSAQLQSRSADRWLRWCARHLLIAGRLQRSCFRQPCFALQCREPSLGGRSAPRHFRIGSA